VFPLGRTTITIAHRLSTIKDVDCIFVIGDGIVLEQGSHSALLSKENGPYSRLVDAQKLREQQEVMLRDSDNDTTTSQADEIQNHTRDEVPLGRQNSGISLASGIIAQKKQLQRSETQSVYNLTYLFVRLNKLNRAVWKNYGIGAVAASCECLSMRCCIKYLTGCGQCLERHTLHLVFFMPKLSIVSPTLTPASVATTAIALLFGSLLLLSYPHVHLACRTTCLPLQLQH